MTTDKTKAAEAAPIVTRGAAVNADIAALFRARNTLLWIVTREEARVEGGLIDAARIAQYDVRFWDCATGLSDASGKVLQANMRDPSSCLDAMDQSSKREVYVLRDVHKWLDAIVLRQLRSHARKLRGAPKASSRILVVLTPIAEVPPELAGDAVVIDYPLPDRAEIAQLLDEVLEVQPEAAKALNGARDEAIDAAVGLTALEATNCYARSLVTTRRIDPAIVAGEKKRVIARDKVLTWHDPDPRGLDAIGGLDLFKGWLQLRKAALTPAARTYGLPPLKGVLIAGIPGTGKSLAAKCIPTAFRVPLLQLDMGALRSKYVGDSEANIRKALAVAEAIAPCVLWLDEIEKTLAGATGPAGDGGVAADSLGKILSWMQERKGSVFVIATANDVRALPPELLRKGRFDEVFWVDLPTRRERVEILRAATTMPQIAQSIGAVDLAEVAEACEGCTGAEIATGIVPDAMFAAFADRARKVTTADLLAARATVVPLSVTAGERLAQLREWGKTNARAASSPEPTTTTLAGNRRALDL